MKRQPAKPQPSDDVLTFFDSVLPSPSWWPWRVFTKALYGLPMDDKEADLYRRCTSRSSLPTKPFTRALVLSGRQSGKTRYEGFNIAYLASCVRYDHLLAPGQLAVVQVVAPSRAQAQNLKNYVENFLNEVPALSRMIVRKTHDHLDLDNHGNTIRIAVTTASYKTERGVTAAAIVLDEGAFFETSSDSANVDREIWRSALPGLTMTHGPAIIISTPYSRSGLVYDLFDKHFGVDGSSVLVWAADALTMNGTIDPAVIEEAYRDDPEVAAAEYGRDGKISFRSDLASLLIRESLMRCIRSDGPRELPQQIGEMAFCDTASGGGDGKEQGDAYGLAIARRGPTGKSIVVLARQWTAPFDPFETTREICAILHSRGLRTVTGDRYSPGWVAGAFKMNGIEYVISERNKSQIYMDMAALVNSEGVEIPDDPILIHQLLHLQRRTGSGGRDNIDHPKHGRDDLANSVSGAATLALHATGPVSLDSLMVSGSICPKNSGLAEEHRVNCVLFGGGYQPSDPICRKACVPWQTVKPQYDAYRRQGGEQPLRLFVRERFTNRIMQANDWFYLRQDTEAMLGL